MRADLRLALQLVQLLRLDDVRSHALSVALHKLGFCVPPSKAFLAVGLL